MATIQIHLRQPAALHHRPPLRNQHPRVALHPDRPPSTPYENGQYWGTLIFPPDYPFAPPAIRMHTPSGRFQPSTRLCLSISDFHPKSFNPAWEVSTILLGLQSFMTSEEMTTGSVRASDAERRLFAQRTRWWNSTGGGTSQRSIAGVSSSNSRGIGAIKAGDGGVKFKAEWPELDEENWKWMKEKRIDPVTGLVVPEADAAAGHGSCLPEAVALRRRPGGVRRGWVWWWKEDRSREWQDRAG
ncbi:Ubiquitin-conjugating enzyme E2 6 [Coniosporium tulheliwenetii]|uniref:Ubiquitin-conjugating enzyme E2 6 n=1 Tax=Coniosporium tulheliwenetii TaxID=3383036 RepID=A0ACC2ZQC5_9PEZI|nr:Ubiquitin-conjugating enzyme E2 6 [Cladosporium sp. JES 115]